MDIRVNRALILVAGISNSFFKPLYDKPKGLFRLKDEFLIERQIRQFQEADLEQKFGVKIFCK